MSEGYVCLILLSIHLIGALITIIWDVITGKFKEVVQNPSGDTPATLLFMDFAVWEIILPMMIVCGIADGINKLFEKKYGNIEK